MKKPTNDPSFQGPIPGENYVADVKNYAWHKPPDITDYDQGVEYIMEKLTKEETVAAIAAMLQRDVSVLQITRFNMLKELKDGTFSVDLAILLAGPTAKTIELIAKSQNIDPFLGWNEKPTLITPEMLDRQVGKEVETEEVPTEDTVESKPEGLMTEPTIEDGEEVSVEEQDEMLGEPTEEIQEEPMEDTPVDTVEEENDG